MRLYMARQSQWGRPLLTYLPLPNRLASISAQADTTTPRTSIFALRFLDDFGQPLATGFKVRLFSTNASIPANQRFNATAYTDSNGVVFPSLTLHQISLV